MVGVEGMDEIEGGTNIWDYRMLHIFEMGAQVQSLEDKFKNWGRVLYPLQTKLKALRVKPSSSKTFKHNTTRIFALKLILVPIRQKK